MGGGGGTTSWVAGSRWELEQLWRAGGSFVREHVEDNSSIAVNPFADESLINLAVPVYSAGTVLGSYDGSLKRLIDRWNFNLVEEDEALSKVQEAIDAAVDNSKFASLVDPTTVQQQGDSLVTGAVNRVKLGTMNQISSAIVSKILNDADDILDKTLNKATEVSSDLNEKLNLLQSDFAQNILGNITTKSQLLTSSTLSQMQTKALSEANTQTINSASVSTNEATDFAEVAMGFLLNNANYSIKAIVEDSVASALAAISGDVFDSKVAAYEQKALEPFYRGINRFSATMMSGNAVSSSAFQLGMAAQEKGFTDQVAEYRATLEVEAYKQGLNSYITLFAQNLNTFLQAYAQTLEAFSRYYRGTFDGYLQLFSTKLSEQIKLYSQKVEKYSNSFLTGLSQGNAVQTSQMGMEFQAAASYLSNYISAYFGNDRLRLQSRVNMVNSQATLGLNKEALQNQILQDIIKTNIGLEQVIYADNVDYKIKQMGFAVKKRDWAMDQWLKAATIIPLGGGGISTNGPDAFSTIASTTATGASIGASVGGVPGAIVGGAVGLVGGIIGDTSR